MGAVGAKKVSFISRFFLTLNFIKSIPSLAATLRLQHRCSIDRENRQNGNQESSQEGTCKEGREESRKEGREEEVIAVQHKRQH